MAKINARTTLVMVVALFLSSSYLTYAMDDKRPQDSGNTVDGSVGSGAQVYPLGVERAEPAGDPTCWPFARAGACCRMCCFCSSDKNDELDEVVGRACCAHQAGFWGVTILGTVALTGARHACSGVASYVAQGVVGFLIGAGMQCAADPCIRYCVAPYALGAVRSYERGYRHEFSPEQRAQMRRRGCRLACILHCMKSEVLPCCGSTHEELRKAEERVERLRAEMR